MGLGTRLDPLPEYGIPKRIKSSTISMVKNSFQWTGPGNEARSNTHFCGQNRLFFLYSDLANFLGQSAFHSNDKILCSKPIPFQWQNAQPHSIPAESAILETSHAFLLICRQFEPSLGTATKATLFSDGLGLPGKLSEMSSVTSCIPGHPVVIGGLQLVALDIQ